MRQTKYIMSKGLAFSEEKDMEKLRRFSLKGWHVSDFKFMGYSLEKGESSDYIYNVDYRSLKEQEEEEYFDFFSSSGWTHVASEANIHLFRAHPGTKPIYTDQETTVEKYRRPSSSIKNFAISLVLLTVLMWVGVIISTGLLNSVLIILAAILSIITVPTVWTAIAAYSNQWKAEGRRGLVNLAKTIPFLFSLLIIIMLFVIVPDSAVRFLASMIIGAIALPTAIWVIMSIYCKTRGKRA
ncbi:DUF2812 domain-containing protein [Oceanobacillus sp. J11TS1]|uniref:DUF2812 domain-containing protein n=1 Tax=Oceanobacillus sp. J11TS1 TaxID=2807191 RepID=UPI001B2F0D79|nr:DUF2812 domain-containing protein [Oceanobacillus sp. J11TS1]GIO22676.1 hypothetical protein J11TS1_12570 [Oceanobacillus sp. J11TS1]